MTTENNLIKVLIIDNQLNDLNIFTNAISSDVEVLLYDSNNTKSKDLTDIVINKLNGNNNSVYLGFVYHNHGYIQVPFFYNQESKFNNIPNIPNIPNISNDNSNNIPNDISNNSNSVITNYDNLKSKFNINLDSLSNLSKLSRTPKSFTPKKSSTYPVFSNILSTLISNLKSNTQISSITIDLLTCDGDLGNYTEINNELSIKIRYSSDPLGNVDSGGNNWILTNPDVVSIKSFYFVPNLIDLWNHDLTSGFDLAQAFRSGTPPIELNPYIKYDSYRSTFKILCDFIWPYDPNDGSNDNYFTLLDNEIFDGNKYTIYFGEYGNSCNYGIFNISNNNINTPSIIKDLTIKSLILNSFNGSGGFIRNGNNNFKIINCHHKGDIRGNNSGGICSQPLLILNSNANIYINKCSQTGNMNGDNNGGIIGGGMFNNIIGTPSNIIMCNITIKNCEYNGVSIGNNCGGICGAIYSGCFNNNNQYTNLIATFKNCRNYAILTGNNVGGICGGADNNYNKTYNNIIDDTFISGGCFGNGNGNNSYLKTSFINCRNSGILNGNNVGGICGGSNNNVYLYFDNITNTDTNTYNINVGGAGCFGNYSSGNIEANFINCRNSGNLGGTNTGGICGGGDNNFNLYYNNLSNPISYTINNNLGGGGCFGNYSSCTLKSNFINCRSSGILSGTNTGGICAGGQNNLNSEYDENIKFYMGGAGCFGNHSNSNNITTNFINCRNSSVLTGTNVGAICAGGDNNNSYGGGCFGNYILDNSTLIATFQNCTNNSNMNGTNTGGICAGGNGGCFGNQGFNSNLTAIFKNCINNGNMNGSNTGGICGGGDNINFRGGGGCFGNFAGTSSNLTSIFQNCINNGNMNGTNVGGICAGGDNNGFGGGGCFGNAGINIHTLTATFQKCINNGNMNGTNIGGICGGGDNKGYIGGGCFGNAGRNTHTLTATFQKCNNKGKLTGTNVGGICAGGDNNNGLGGGGGCFGNYINNNQYNDIEYNFNVKITSCENYGKIKGTNCGGICAGGYSYNDNKLNDNYGCFGNALYINNTLAKGIFNIVIEKCINANKISGPRSGGICASHIAIPYINNQTPSTKYSINIIIQSCKNIVSRVGRYKKLNHNTYIPSSSGGIIGGYLNGTQPTSGIGACAININIRNCYVLGYLANGSGGIVGTSIGTPESTYKQINSTGLNIYNCYVSPKDNAKNPYVIADTSEGMNIINCYYGKSLKKITGHLDNLPHKYWKKRSHKLPVLKY